MLAVCTSDSSQVLSLACVQIRILGVEVVTEIHVFPAVCTNMF